MLTLALAALISPLLPVAACASHPSSPAATIAAPAPDARAQRVPRLIVPSGRGALRYAAWTQGAAEPVVAPPADPLRAAILEDARALARRAGLPLPDGDPRLDLAMNDLARGLRGDDLPALEVVDFLLSHYGIVEPQPNLLLGKGTAAADMIIRKQTAAQVAEVLKVSTVAHIGVGIERAAGEMHVVVALQEQNVEVDPVPRRIAPGASAVVSGKLIHRFVDPRVVVTGPSGAVKHLPGDGPGPAFHSEMRCDAGPGRYQVEVTGANQGGPAVLANFPVYCGVTPPAEAPRDAGLQQGVLNPGEVERRLLDLVNRDRVAAGLPQVTLDGKLSEIARAHSDDMATHDYVAHVSPTTGTVLDRARRAGLQPLLILENVGRAYSPDEAETGFMSSPGHRGNILDRRATRIGIGVAVGKPVTGTNPLFVTQLLM
jgi:uncharacterized protein YkwD